MLKKNRLKIEAEKLGIAIDDNQSLLFDEYMRLLLLWNERVNLTAITQPEQIIAKHFVDSLSLLRFISPQAPIELLDAGTGAGFPGLP
ncbi:MAG: class I SAM-dependent methyltransferase, partial [Clostridiales bacterium]|nr:class I SAM-dependent methyltransferase [Clostridiales bacterium]